MTPAAKKAVKQAAVVIGAQRSLNLFTQDIKGETVVLTAKNLNSALKGARKTVQQAEVVIGAQRSLNLFTEDIKGETMVLTAKNLNSALKFAVESAEKGKNVALLSTGDPGFSGF